MPGPILAYAGTYKSPVGAEGGPGKGVYLFEMNPATGVLMSRVRRTSLPVTRLVPDRADADAARRLLEEAEQRSQATRK